MFKRRGRGGAAVGVAATSAAIKVGTAEEFGGLISERAGEMGYGGQLYGSLKSPSLMLF